MSERIPLSVSWQGTPKKLWSGMRIEYCGTDPSWLRQAIYGASLISVDPGKPCGVAIWPYDDRDPITLHEVPDPSEISEAFSQARGAVFHIVCETPLHGAVRVYDPWPWRVRGYLELFQTAHSRARDGNLFVPANVGWLKAGRNIATVSTKNVSRHAKDALAYGAVAVSTNHELRKPFEGDW